MNEEFRQRACVASHGDPAAGATRILLVRTSSLGDVVHALPVLAALRRHLPAARLGWVVEEPYAPLLAGHPDLDELIVVRLRRWRKRPLGPRALTEMAAFLAALDRFAPQVVLDLMGSHKAAAIAALSLAPRRIGLGRSFRREPSSSMWLSETVPAQGAHAVDRALSLLDALGLPSEPADFGGAKLFRAGTAAGGGAGVSTLAGAGALPPAAADLPSAWGAVAQATGGRFVLLHPGAGWGNKAYPAAWWGEALDRLYAATGVRALVAAAPGEEPLAAAVATAAGAAAEPVPAPDLPALAALLRQAVLVLGGDSGPTHLAHALGTPVLMVMGPTDPERHGPYGAPERAIHRRLPCSFCYRRFAEAKACLLEIPPRSIAERAAALLDSCLPRPAGAHVSW
jgi:heptosyltransferase-1